MAELKCPHCGEVFKVDDSGYAAIVNQVRGREFDEEVARRLQDKLEAAEQQKRSELLKIETDKNAEIAQLKSRLEASDSERDIALAKAAAERERELGKKDAEIMRLKAESEKHETEKQLEIGRAVGDVSAKLGAQIAELKTEAAKKDSEYKLAMNEAVAKVEKEKQDAVSAAEKQRDEQKITYEMQLKMKDEQIEQYRDFKAKQSTKMIGESLERHCEDEFNKLRMTAFPTAYFEKDNDARTGSKGDYIYREERDGVELVSIMFEMKNEMDTTSSKHKNEHFFKELDKDRREKGCEYAVLVSLLEADSEYYNSGIVSVYQYEKMYVIRPQFFIPLITLLRNAAMNAYGYKQQLESIRQQNIDLTHFEENITGFAEMFSKHYGNAGAQFDKAIKEIDESIKRLENVKKALTTSLGHMSKANSQIEKNLNVAALTKNAPSVAQMFEDTSDTKALTDNEE